MPAPAHTQRRIRDPNYGPCKYLLHVSKQKELYEVRQKFLALISHYCYKYYYYRRRRRDFCLVPFTHTPSPLPHTEQPECSF